MSIHFEIREEDPKDVRVGEWCLFVPVAIADRVYGNPPMVQIRAIRKEEQDWKIETTSGVMVLRSGEKVQVID